MKLLVLGVGNVLLSDDGLGVHAANELMKETFPENVTIMEAGTFTQDIFYLFDGYTHILVLDVLHGRQEPGTCYRLTEKELTQNDSQRMSIHDVDLIDSLNMAELVNKYRPEIYILAMEPADYLTWSMELTPPLQEKFQDYLGLARKEIQRLLDLEKA